MTYRNTASAWKYRSRQAKHSKAVKEYPAVRRATTKTERTAELNLSSGLSVYMAGRIKYLEGRNVSRYME